MENPAIEQSPAWACLGKTHAQKALTVSVLTLSTAAIAVSSFVLMQGYLPWIGGVLPMHAWIVLGSAATADAFMINLCFYRIYQAHLEVKKQGCLQELLNELGHLVQTSSSLKFIEKLEEFIQKGGDITKACNKDGENLLHVVVNTQIQMEEKVNSILEKIQNYSSDLRNQLLNGISQYSQSPLLKILTRLHAQPNKREDYISMMKKLVTAGADTQQQLQGDLTPFNYIEQRLRMVSGPLKGLWQQVQNDIEKALQARPATVH